MVHKTVLIFTFFGICSGNLVIHLQDDDLNVKVGPNITATEGDSVRLICSNLDSPTSDVVWSKVETHESKNQMVQLPLKTEKPSVLEFKSVLLPDEGRYWCTDKAGEEVISVYIDVRAASINDGHRVPVNVKTSFASFSHGEEISDPAVNEQPELVIMQQTPTGQQLAPSTITTREGEEIALMCVFKEVGGTIDYDVTWTKLESRQKGANNQKMYMQKSMNGFEPPKLVIKPITFNDVGRYICFKKNINLYQSVYIKVKPHKSTPPNTDMLVGPARPQACKTMDKEHLKIIEELQKGLEAACIISRELLKKISEVTSAA